MQVAEDNISGSVAEGFDNSGGGYDSGIKKCPICKTTLFSDMDTCYGCMYSFGSNPELEKRIMQESDLQREQCEGLEEPEQRRQPGQSGQHEQLRQRKIVLPVIESVADRGSATAIAESENCLFNKFLVQFHGFLGDFIADAQVNIN